MATVILYYSHSGHTKSLAKKLKKEKKADIFEIREVKKRNGFTAFMPGAFQSIRMKRSEIEPLEADLSTYDEVVIMGPIWAGRPAPAVNSAIDLLPEGKTVSLICTAGGGGHDLSGTAALITAKGCTVAETRSYGVTEL